MTTLAFRAMQFATKAHAGQTRKFTGEPYVKHCAEVAAIAMSCGWQDPFVHPDTLMAVAWLHDTVEDTDTTLGDIGGLFGEQVFDGVKYLTNEKALDRTTRKIAECDRLSYAPGWIHTIKLADILSNLPTIVERGGPEALRFVDEKLTLMLSLNKGNQDLYRAALRALSEADRKLSA